MKTLGVCSPRLALAVSALFCSCLARAACADEAQQEAEPQRVKVLVTGQEQAEPGQQQRIEVLVTGQPQEKAVHEYRLLLSEEGTQAGKRWIGVLCTPLDNELLQNHLDIQDAMVITQVIEGSPAEKAGLEPHDLLLKIGDKPLSDLTVLSEAIEQAGDQEVELTILHRGTTRQIKLVPAERPVNLRLSATTPDQEAKAEWRMLQDALIKRGAIARDKDAADNQEDKDHDFSLMLVMPGFVIPEQAKDLPSDLEVTITKKGEGAAQITIKRGEEKWEVDANSLDKLPDDLRPHIKKMLGKAQEVRIDSAWMDAARNLKLPAPRLLLRSLELPSEGVYQLHELEGKLHKEIQDKVRKQLEHTQRAVENVRTQIPAETLERIEKELQSLRQQLEELRAAKKQNDDEQDT